MLPSLQRMWFRGEVEQLQLFEKISEHKRAQMNTMPVLFSSNNLDRQTVRGSTALHYCCLHNKTECLKLLLRAKANTHISKEQCKKVHVIARARGWQQTPWLHSLSQISTPRFSVCTLEAPCSYRLQARCSEPCGLSRPIRGFRTESSVRLRNNSCTHLCQTACY